MNNRKCVYLTEGECEEKLIKALKEKPSLLMPGKVKKFELLKKQCENVELLTIVQVLNFEDEIVNSTDVIKAQELTKSMSEGSFKSAVNRMKPIEFRRTLKRHKLDITKLWEKKPPKAFCFVKQDSEKIKV